MKSYKTILDELGELYKKEGHSYYSASIVDDKVNFGLPPIKKIFYTNNPNVSRNSQNEVPPKENNEGSSEEDRPQKDGKKKQLKLPKSSTIQAAAYWPNKQYLVVSFKSGATYGYDDVPKLTIDLWQTASSAGSWFYYNIRLSYKYQKLG